VLLDAARGRRPPQNRATTSPSRSIPPREPSSRLAHLHTENNKPPFRAGCFGVEMGGIGQESVKIIVASLLDFLRLTTLARRQALARKRARLVYRLRLSIPPAKSSLFASHLQSIKKKHLFKRRFFFMVEMGGIEPPSKRGLRVGLRDVGCFLDLNRLFLKQTKRQSVEFRRFLSI